MAYEMEEIRLSQEIFYYLLEHHELREEKEAALYKAYAEREEVQNLVKSQGEIARSNIERYGDMISSGFPRRSLRPRSAAPGRWTAIITCPSL